MHTLAEYQSSRCIFSQNVGLPGGVRHLRGYFLRLEGHSRLLKDRQEYLCDPLFRRLDSC